MSARRHSALIRWSTSTLLAGACVLVGGGFWLTVKQDDASILGRYSVQWFVIALCASVACALLGIWGTRGLWRKSPASSPAGSSLGKKVLFSVVMLVPVLIIIEVVLRFTLFAASPDGETQLLTMPKNYHALLQVTNRTKVDDQWVRAYRDKVYDRAKSTEFRVVCLGGSTTWGQNVRAESAWPAVMERLLRNRGYDVEVINAGVPWYSTAQSLVNYATQMRYFDPDLVIVMHGVNDLCRSFPAPGEPQPELDYGSYQGPLYLALSAAGASRAARKSGSGLIAGSALWTLVCAATNLDRYYYSALGSRRQSRRERRHGESNGRQTGELDLEAADYPSIESFKTHLNYLVELCLHDQRHILLGTQAHVYRQDLADENSGPPQSMRTSLFRLRGRVVSMKSLRGAMRAIREAVFEIAAGHGIALADAESAIDGRAEYFGDDFHLLEAGHEIVAGAFAEKVGPILDNIRTARP